LLSTSPTIVSECNTEYNISGLGSASSLTVLLNIGDEIFLSVVT